MVIEADYYNRFIATITSSLHLRGLHNAAMSVAMVSCIFPFNSVPSKKKMVLVTGRMQTYSTRNFQQARTGLLRVCIIWLLNLLISKYNIHAKCLTAEDTPTAYRYHYLLYSRTLVTWNFFLFLFL